VVQPHQDSSNSVENRVEDLLARLTVRDKAGLMFHDIIMIGPGGQLISSDNPFGRPATEVAIRDMRRDRWWPQRDPRPGSAAWSTTRLVPRGRLPFDLPSSTKAVTDSRSDVPYDTANPLFRFGDGIVD
jgi:hypothetical protein